MSHELLPNDGHIPDLLRFASRYPAPEQYPIEIDVVRMQQGYYQASMLSPGKGSRVAPQNQRQAKYAGASSEQGQEPDAENGHESPGEPEGKISRAWRTS